MNVILKGTILKKIKLTVCPPSSNFESKFTKSDVFLVYIRIFLMNTCTELEKQGGYTYFFAIFTPA